MLVPVIERPGSVCLVVPDPGYVGFGPDALVLEIWALLGERDGHSLGDVSDADLGLGGPGDEVDDIAVKMGFDGCPDVVWTGYGDSGVPSLALIGQG